ncbi:phospholipase A2 family protein [Peptoniphilus rhinitidis]|uniref:phospholipase A2 family protein n=1 Tax=Peptoniphilus rhinitidis TaxID=1175452 RepID=UPI0023533155|nr:phospholipase A2 family protein [Peptoniphilus rhinitidis]
MFLISFIFIFNNMVFASSTNADLYDQEDLIIKQAKNYILKDKEGYVYFDIQKAQKDRVSKDVIEVGKIVNEITESYKNNNFSYNRNGLREYSSKNLSGLGRYGHYCGKGNDGWDKTPIDELDAACQNHDRCYVWGGDNTICNERFCNALEEIINYGSGTAKINYARAAKLIFCN